MSLTSTYFDIINGYRKAVAEAQHKADNKIILAEKAKGSPLYDELLKEADESLKEAANVAREAARPKLRAVIDEMRKNISKQKPTPPTAEMLEKLQFLKMRFDVMNDGHADDYASRDTVTYEDLKEAAAFCQGNAEAMKVVNDMARRKGVVIPNIKETVGGDLCEKVVDSLEKEGFTALNLPRVNNTTKWYEMHNNQMTGVEDTTDGRAFDFFRVDRDLPTERDMVSRYGGLYPDNYTEATAIING